MEQRKMNGAKKDKCSSLGWDKGREDPFQDEEARERLFSPRIPCRTSSRDGVSREAS